MLSKAQVAREYAVELQKTGDNYPYGITWKSNPRTTWRTIFSKDPDGLNWQLIDSSLNAGNTFIDSTLLEGQRRDYAVIEYRDNFKAYGYISLGHHYRSQNKKREVLLLIDSNYQLPLQNEIAELFGDLKSENWMVSSRYCGRKEPVQNIKSWIQTQYESDTNKEYYVYLLGRIPVPYSGVLVPDGHYPGHFGAWPSDVYYVIFDSSWTDSLMNFSLASDPRNHNVPGDGKFDPWEIDYQKAKIPIGRVDLFNMPAFGNDTFLVRRYLNKAHRFRKAEIDIEARAIIDDNFGAFGGEAFSSSAWRTFSTLLGDSVQAGDYRTKLDERSYLFSYGCGGGSYTSAGGIGTSFNFVNDSFANPFTMLFGSYFGDWDNTNNYLRAPLASKGWGLSNVWSGRPMWMFHHSGLGDPIGRASLESQKADSSIYFVGYGDAFVHAAFMGDPTLPVYPLEGGNNLTAYANCSEQKIYINWTKSSAWDSVEVLQKNQQNELTILATLTADSQSFNDYFPHGIHHFYVRGKNLKHTPSGSFFQYSPWMETEIRLNENSVAKIGISKDSLCFGDSIHLSDLGSGGISWNRQWILNEQFVGDAKDTSLIPRIDGTFSLHLQILNDSNCVSRDSLTFTVLPEPDPVFRFDKSHYCFGDSIWMIPYTSNSRDQWFSDASLLSEDSLFLLINQSSGYLPIEHISYNPLGCPKSYIDSVSLSGKLLKNAGLSPFNHSICLDSDQDKGQAFIETEPNTVLELWLDNTLQDSLFLKSKIYSSSFQFFKSGTHQFKAIVRDSMFCEESESFSFQVFDKAPLPMKQDSLILNTRTALLVSAEYYPKAYYFWGGYCNNGPADSAHKRYYGCGTEMDGDYTQWVVLEDSNQCISDTSYFKILLQTGINQAETIAFHLYPNPGSGEVNWQSDIEMEKLNVYGMDGKILSSFDLKDHKPQLHLELIPGSYLLDFISQDGHHLRKKLLIK